jgi:hypothetical protein
LMEGYFDAFLYTANWGTRRLMVRLPARPLDLETAPRYCHTDSATAWAHVEHVIIELCRENGEEGYWEEESGQGRLASIIPARTQLASGDLRLLYLGWLLSTQSAPNPCTTTPTTTWDIGERTTRTLIFEGLAGRALGYRYACEPGHALAALTP